MMIAISDIETRIDELERDRQMLLKYENVCNSVTAQNTLQRLSWLIEITIDYLYKEMWGE